MAIIQMKLYSSFMAKMFNKEMDLDSDTITVTLHTASYTPDYATHDYVDDLTNELGTASGYTAGGVNLTTKSIVKTAANSWSPTWATGTAVNLGEIRRPSTGNGFVYRVSVAGTTHASTEPTWPTTIGATVTDNGITWTCVGTSVVAFKSDAVQWASFSAGPFRYVVFSDRTPGSDATRPLIGVLDYGSNQTGGGGNFDITPDTNGWLTIAIP